MQPDSDVVWSGNPWIGPALVVRTVAVVILAVLVTVILSMTGLQSVTLLSMPLYAWAFAILALAWLASVVGLLVLRASYRYILRQSSIELVQGIARKKTLVVSPSGFAELELDQGIAGRILNYGTLDVRSQGGQQLTLELIRDPRTVSTKIREIMSVPTVRIASGSPLPQSSGNTQQPQP